MHKKWSKTNLLEQMKAQAAKRNLKDLTIGPVLSWNNDQIKAHIDAILALDGAELLFGGAPLKNNSIPAQYGSYEPTAIKVPLKHFNNTRKRKLLTTELFGPFQVVTEYTTGQFPKVMKLLDNLPHHLTAALVSNDPILTNYVLGHTINGTTYHGLKARTTGAPQNHWFGPCGDPRGAGIGTPYAIQHTWSHHREIISDYGPVSEDWTMPPPA
mmetsp:Transcript_8450/g.12901  ORF Transcript_8450/g.12901 Transcript_8450/m.12901 type:complete len:213 (+) Transcript_8450:1054-1692(+)